MSTQLSNALNMNPLPPDPPKVEVLPAVVDSDKSPQAVRVTENSTKDYEYARENIKDAISQGQEALDGILEVAKIGQHPRSFEVAAALVKTIVEANKELLALSKQQADINTQAEPSGKPAAKTTNNLFVGSTSELLRALKNNQDQDQ